MLSRRPPAGRFREQLFWLVDIIYACKSSDHIILAGEAGLVEDALGSLGEFLETGDMAALELATSRVEKFAAVVNAVVAEATGS
ncbi:hypothetical protein KAI87_04535 [Myxococcota bacterium]|nr:hypothetical protein [Myxococcota bacterium]